MIIADENIFDVIIQALESEGYDVLSIKNSSFRGLSDFDIVGLSINPPKIIITEDKDFGDIVFLENKKVTGVILLRYKAFERPEIIKELILFLKGESLKSLTNNFITISLGKIRIRKIQNQP